MTNDWLSRFIAGEIPPHLALMQLFIGAESEARARQALQNAILHADHNGVVRLNALQNMWAESPNAWSIVSRIHDTASGSDPGPDRLQHLRSIFDQAAGISSEAAVALYSLGRRDLLAMITSDVVTLMRAWELIDQTSLVAEVGCGTGRFMHALAPLVRAIVGFDISGAMLRHAAEQARQFSNALAVQTAGTSLDVLADASLDLVLALDSFPYLVEAGVAEAHIAECARVLKPAGYILIMNWDYSTSLAVQRETVATLAAKHGFAILRNGTSDLQSWDGKAFLLQKAVL